MKLHDFKRNFIVLTIACVLNFAFALEKLFIVIGSPLSDVIWLFVYGGISVILTVVAYYDYFCDTEENHGTDVERII